MVPEARLHTCDRPAYEGKYFIDKSYIYIYNDRSKESESINKR